MGRIFHREFLLLITVCWVLVGQKGAAESILFPPAPRTVLPPDHGSKDIMLEDLNKMRNRRLEREARENHINWEQWIKENLKKEALKPRKYNFMVQTSIIYPFITTTGERESYQVDITSHFMSLYKLVDSPKSPEDSIWVGLRIAPFAGYGVQETYPGRYGLIFFGPAISWGGIGPINALEEGDHSLPTRDGSFVSVGLAPAFTSGQKDGATEEEPTDFLNQRAPVIDVPGVWFEYSQVTINYGALGTHYVLGAQVGASKTFFWIGMAVSGWS